MHQFLKFMLFCSSTLHVSDGTSVHHQESKNLSDIHMMLYVQSSTPDDGRKDRPKHVRCYYKIT